MAPKHALLKLASLSGLSALARRKTGAQLRILCYHGLWVIPGAPYGNCLFMTPQLFEARMTRLRRSGLPVLPLGEAVERLAADDLPPASVVITIDDGWVSTRTHMLPVLERLELPATLYAATWYSGRDLPVINVAASHFIEASGRSDIDRTATIRWIESLPEAERLAALRDLGRRLGIDEAWLEARQFHVLQPDELADCHQRGLDIQLHTHRHIDVEAQIGSLAREIAENRDFIADATGAPPAVHFCYPGGSFHPRAPAVLASSGVRSATLVTEGINSPGTDAYRLRRFLDGPSVSRVEFDAYLSGTLHYLSSARGLARDFSIDVGGGRAAAASSMLLCAI